MKRPIATEDAFEEFSRVLRSDGVRAALAFLVSLTDYRFIGIFRFESGSANAAVHYDRANPDETQAQEVHETATYCCYVRDTKGVFTTANALADERLTHHPARAEVLAYCGVPILASSGQLLGTLCHYDTVARDPDRIDLELILQAASAIAYGNFVPPYPRRAS